MCVCIYIYILCFLVCQKSLKKKKEKEKYCGSWNGAHCWHTSTQWECFSVYNYLLDKVIPSILKVGPKEQPSPTLVSGVHRGPPQADKEHWPASLHLLWPCPQEACQVRLELFLVCLCCALIGTMDEHSPFVVCCWSLVHHTLWHLCGPHVNQPTVPSRPVNFKKYSLIIIKISIATENIVKR